MLHQQLKSYLKLTTLITLLCLVIVVFTSQEAQSINSVLNLNDTFPYLINKTNGRVIEPRDYMDFDNIYAPNETYARQQTAQGRNYHLLKAFDFANYFQSDYWHYSNEEDLRRSAEPVANKDKCSQHLDWLERKLNSSQKILFEPGEQHTNLMNLMDSFGRPEAATYFGHGYWLGSHYQCSKVFVDVEKFEQEECRLNSTRCDLFNAKKNNSSYNDIELELSKMSTKLKTRYCIGKARDIDWPDAKADNYVPTITYKVGLCLPETCETLSFKEHRDQIKRLMLFNMPEYLKPRIQLNDMYCAPDSRSPIRALSLSARIFLGICILWLMILIAATSVYSCYKRNQKDLHNIIIVGQTRGDFSPIDREQPEDNQLLEVKLDKICEAPLTLATSSDSQFTVNYMVCQSELEKSDSLLSNHAQLLILKAQAPVLNRDQDNQSNSSYRSTLSSFSSWLNLTQSPFMIRLSQALSIKENLKDFQEPPVLLRSKEASNKLRINLNSLDSIKCLCCILVILGHIVFIHMQHLSNIVHTIELSSQLAPRFLIAFFNFVDTFFIISGLLTSYFVFKRFNKDTFGRPMVWISISLLRFLRLSPVYVLLFWFIKTLSVHLADGPIWDYGTDKNSMRGLCTNDHWWKSILYLGNLGTMQPLCILPAWSIIVDAQYSLVVPPVLFFIFKHKRLGYLSLLVAVIVSTANMSFQLANQTAVKTSDMAKVRLHIYPLISRFAAEFYNTAWNRIGPVAIGILGGHMLYLYDIGQIRRWPWYMRGAAFKFVLILHLIIFILPSLGHLTDDSKSSNETDLTIFVLSNSTIKPLWSLINTVFLLRLVTDLRLTSVIARLMSHNIWHCLGKLCFTSYLVHYEVIMVLLKSRQEGLVDPNWINVAREFSLAFLISTAIAYVVHILYEAPINKLINLAIAKPEYLKKKDEDSLEINEEKPIVKFNKNNQQEQLQEVV